jgi:hypothetical protein
MKSYRGPSYQDRVARADDAKQKALDQLRARPAADPEAVARRQADRLARETARAEKRAAASAAEAEARAAVKAVAVAPPPPSEEERKAARDARYAARKSRR